MRNSKRYLAPLVLVIEDHPLWSESIQSSLLREGYRTAGARDGAEGLLLSEALCPDLILLTLALPVMDGLEFLQHYAAQAQRLGRRSPIIAMTAIHAYRYQALDLGADLSLQLPVDQEYLMDAIVGLLSEQESPLSTPRELIGSAVLSGSSTFRVESRDLSQLQGLLQADAVSVSSVQSGRAHFNCGSGHLADKWSKNRLSFSDSPCQLVLESAQWLGVGDFCVNPLFRPSSWRVEQGLRSYAGAPILSSDGRAVGTLAVHGKKSRIFHHTEKYLMTSFADRLAGSGSAPVHPQGWLIGLLPCLIAHANQAGVRLSIGLLQGEDQRLQSRIESCVASLPWQLFFGADPVTRSWLVVGWDMEASTLRGWTVEISAGTSAQSIRILSRLSHLLDSGALRRELYGSFEMPSKDTGTAA